MILDSSALLAVYFMESDRNELLDKIDAADAVGIGAPTLAETTIVASARVGDAAEAHLERIVERAAIVVVPFDTVHARTAADAWRRYGRGRHPASLNFGDCLAYATARCAGEPLLCKGDDFARTDLVLA